MKIAQSSVSLASQHSYIRHTSSTETLHMWKGTQRPAPEAAEASGHNSGASIRVALSEAARRALDTAIPTEPALQNTSGSSSADAINNAGDTVENDPRLRLLLAIVEALSGQKIRLLDTQKFSGLTTAASTGPAASEVSGQPPLQGWGLEYDYHESTHETEVSTFKARGEIITADGKQLQFSIDLAMSREFHHETSVSIRAGDAVRKDPLVINFDGSAAELSSQKFAFDIDADGHTENLSFVTSASGFLALDNNGNGRIDDGSELFGALTGNGFSELAAYDDDGNGWIDENDRVFALLRIWTKDANGADRLTTLADHNIGALYLGKTATPFDLNDAQNRQHGQIRETGVYLTENGQAGTLQQIDLFA